MLLRPKTNQDNHFSLSSPPDALVQHILVFLASLGRELETRMVTGKHSAKLVILKINKKVSIFMREKKVQYCIIIYNIYILSLKN